jgi:hypothetical protein
MNIFELESELNEIIDHYHENDRFDFKLKEYVDKEELLKDVLAFSNSSEKGNKFIIVGVKKRDKMIIVEEVVQPGDSASIQQLVHNNITPELPVDYIPFKYKDKQLVVLVLKNPTNKPYSFKKNYGKCKENEILIRKGSYKKLISRLDLDRIYSERYHESHFEGEVEIAFFHNLMELDVYVQNEIQLTSDKMKREIEEVIRWKEDLLRSAPIDLIKSDFYHINKDLVPMMPFQGTTYKERSLKTLKSNLAEVHNTYRDEDLYNIYEERSEKVNFYILNNGNRYLEDASIVLKIAKPGLLVADKVYVKPKHSNFLNGTSSDFNSFSHTLMSYPSVEETDEFFVIRENLDDVKHLINTRIFKTDLRIFFSSQLTGGSVNLLFQIFAKNLKIPLEKSLIINVR